MSESHRHRARPPGSSSRSQRRHIRTQATENDDLATFLKSNGNAVPPGLQTAKPLGEPSTSVGVGPSTLRRPEKQAGRENSEPVSDLQLRACLYSYFF
jgi:hypothetical protein